MKVKLKKGIVFTTLFVKKKKNEPLFWQFLKMKKREFSHLF
jgi:hypothetical protein